MMMVPSKIFSSLQFFTFLYLLTVTFASTEEATALLKWKATFKNQNNSLSASWTPSSNACRDWYGVISINGRVNGLTITNSSVIGTLYAFPFSSLPFLENLNLSMNNFSGNIPPEIGNLTNLISGTIPPQISSLAKLQTLCIFHNHLNGPIPEEIGYLRSLTKLSLGNNSLNGSIPASLGNLNNLSFLLLYQNHLSGSIPEEIGYIRTLTDLRLHDNSLTGSIPASLGNLNSLSYLILHRNQLSGLIPPEIETNYTASALDDQESNSEFLNDFWKAALMGYGSGLCIGLSIMYFMISTGNPKWLARIIEEMEHKINMRRRKKQRGQRNYRSRNNRF
ncbi:hypothetical protein H5410_029698 [Solanum commersonii]|uniref:Leucine-rich repeat-containing N-terminal plant-type domain-containing protein n=1 Tax=Solanum commersonii TaxID=4109 RepID=A0A9J5YFC6_SOLCO|nr:hypothetical protein H5410_029698 [Solanum commersonii]